MASAWVENGPIALPSRGLAYGAGVMLLMFAVLGVGLGFQASLRRSSGPDLDSASSLGAGKDDALIAKPIVDLAPPPAAADADKDGADAADDEADKADALAAQTAVAQAIQAKAAKDGGNIDDVLTSPTEKPPGATKGPADEAPPGAPLKSEVPF